MIKLRDFRKACGLTQQQLADAVGVLNVSISNYERGTQMPDLTTLTKIADTLHVTTDELLGRSSHVGENKAPISDRDIRFALSGGDDPITVKQYDEVKQFVRFIRERDNGANV